MYDLCFTGTSYFTSEAIKKYKTIADLLPNNETVQTKLELMKELNEHDVKYIAPPRRNGSMTKEIEAEKEYTAWRRSDAFKQYASEIMEKIDIVDQMPLDEKTKNLYKRPLEHWEFKDKKYENITVEDSYEESIALAVTTYEDYLGYETHKENIINQSLAKVNEESKIE